jgi:hypothetical protein
LDALRTCIVQDLPDVLHVSSRLHKAGCHKVHLVLAAEVLQVIDVIGCQHWQIHVHTRQVAVLALPQLVRVDDLALQLLLIEDLLDLNADGSVSCRWAANPSSEPDGTLFYRR